MFNFPLVLNVIQLLWEGESRERYLIREHAIPKIKTRQLPSKTVGPNSSPSCHLVPWLRRHPKLANHQLTLESSLLKAGQFRARRVSDYNRSYWLFISNIPGNGAEKETPEETNSSDQMPKEIVPQTRGSASWAPLQGVGRGWVLPNAAGKWPS